MKLDVKTIRDTVKVQYGNVIVESFEGHLASFKIVLGREPGFRIRTDRHGHGGMWVEFHKNDALDAAIALMAFAGVEEDIIRLVDPRLK